MVFFFPAVRFLACTKRNKRLGALFPVLFKADLASGFLYSPKTVRRDNRHDFQLDCSVSPKKYLPSDPCAVFRCSSRYTNLSILKANGRVQYPSAYPYVEYAHPFQKKRFLSTSQENEQQPPQSNDAAGQKQTPQQDIAPTQSSATPEFPPNATVALVAEESPSATVQSNSVKGLKNDVQARPEIQIVTGPADVTSGNGLHSDTASGRSSIRQATRVALASIPGGAYAVMQQQFFLTRHIALRYRAWRTRRVRQAHVAETQVPTSPSTTRLGRKSRRRRAQRQQRSAQKSAAGAQSAFEGRQAPSAGSPQLREAENSQDAAADKSPTLNLNVTPKTAALDVSLSTEDVASREAAENHTSSIKNVCDQSELMRHYEAVLQMVLAAGVVGQNEKQFLAEYRKRCNISDQKHLEALKRLGWNLAEFQQGALSSMADGMPSWRRLLNRALDLCETKGNYIVTIGSIASLTSIMMASMVHLRMLQLVAGVVYFGYNITRRPPLVSAAYWNLVFFAINAFMLLRLMLERRPETFSEAELDIFERHFLSSGLSPRQFKKLLSIAAWRTVPQNEVVVRQGEPIDELKILYRGKLRSVMNGSEVEIIEGGSTNAILGLCTFLMRVYDTNSTTPDSAINESLPDATSSAESSSATAYPVSNTRSASGELQAPAEAKNTNSKDCVEKVASPRSSSSLFKNHTTSSATTVSPKVAPSDAEVSLPDKQSFTGTSQAETVQDTKITDSGSKYSRGRGSPTTVIAAEDSTILVWKMDELVARVKADPVNVGFPVVGGVAKSLVARTRHQSLRQSLTNYKAVLQAVLSDGQAQTEEKHFLRECREKFNISDEHHWEALAALGWSREEFEDGARRGVVLQPANRAIRAILSIMTDQRRPETPSDAS